MHREQAADDLRPNAARKGSLAGRSAKVLARMGLCATAVFAFAAHGADRSAPGVLILHSNQQPTPAQVIIDNALRKVVPEAFKRPVELYSEYLDDEWGSIQKYGPLQAQFLQSKYGDRNIRVIVANALPALQFAAQFRDGSFPGVPVVHLAVARDRLGRVSLPEDMIGNTENHDPTPTLRLALRLHPDTKRIYLIRGASSFDRGWESRLRGAAAQVESGGVKIEFLSGLDTADVLQRVSALKRGDIVFTPGYFADGAGAVSTPYQSIKRIAEASAVPVYGAFDSQLGTGIVGGYFNRYEDQTKAAGAIVVTLLNGTPPTTIPTSSAPRVAMLDWRELQRWGVDERLVPSDAIMTSREPTVWERYRWQIALAFAIIASQSILIAALVLQRRRRRHAEIETQAARAELTHAARLASMGELTASIAHEIKQPLSAILAHADTAELLLETDAPALPEIQRILAEIRKDDLRASDVITRLRDLLGKHTMERRPVDLNEAVSDALAVVEAEARRRGVMVVTQLASGIPPIIGDHVHLQQVVLNLVLNGMDAVAGVDTPARRITVSTKAAADGVEFTVADSGPGIDPAIAPRLFESFATTKSRGLGLGLSIARTIVEAHGGTIRAAADAGHGAVFRVVLPTTGADVDAEALRAGR
jgi:signal transduction histidine kinase